MALTRLMLAATLAMFATAAPARADIPQIRHIILVIQENRTPDNLFQGLNAWVPGVDIASSGLDSSGQSIPLVSEPLVGKFDLDHEHIAFIQMYDHGKMDGADRVLGTPKAECPSHPAYGAVQRGDVLPYFEIARNYGFANRMFQTNQGPSFPSHQFLIAGTSQPSSTSLFFAAENPPHGYTDPIGPTQEPTGCLAPTSQHVTLIGPSGGETEKVYPCFEHQTLMDLLDAPPAHPKQPISWRYYTPLAGSIWTAPNAIAHLCKAKGNPLVCAGPSYRNGSVVLKSTQILNDIANGDLAGVSWVIPTGQASDHAGATDGSGPSWVASIVNEVGGSAYWRDTAILILWDDWGGWYDHVAPPISKSHGAYEYGFRVPLLVVSPYTKAGYVSNVQHDFGSILAFIEKTFGLGTIPPHTFADSLTTDSLMDFFEFSSKPRSFVPISAPLGPDDFIHDTRVPLPPDDD